VETKETWMLPRIHVTERIIQYSVSGNTVFDVRQAMKRMGPLDRHGRHFAFTLGQVFWKLSFDQIGGQCRIAEVDIEGEITQTYPTWSDHSPSATLVAAWDRLVAELREHEAGHRRIILDALQELGTRMNRAIFFATCEDARRSADALGASVLDHADMAHIEYDKENEPR
jgi:predicted secreted Zn-dependent protease